MHTNRAYEVALGDRKVVFVELDTGGLRQAMQIGGREKVEAARNLEVALAGLRLSVREVDGRRVGYDDLIGPKWDALFSVRETMLLAKCWNQVHMPEDQELDSVGEALRAVASST